MAGGLYLGIDIGSTASKCVVADAAGEVRGTGVYPSGAGTKGPQEALDAALGAAGASMDGVARACATGYGRKLMTWVDSQVSELSCHAKGASVLFPGVRTVIDIGGQDAKVLRLSPEGDLENFVMNDKCAAGTGRFLDVMAGVFGIGVDELSDYDRASHAVASISSTCTVFAESEVVSKLASGEPIADIVAGVHESVVDRCSGLVKRLGIVRPVAMTGGVALNDALRERLEKRLESPIATSEFAQMNGAYGAAIFAMEGR